MECFLDAIDGVTYNSMIESHSTSIKKALKVIRTQTLDDSNVNKPGKKTALVLLSDGKTSRRKGARKEAKKIERMGSAC